MTDTDLKRGEEIQSEISHLQSSLSQISRARIFDIEASSCTMRRSADPFLAELEADIRSSASKKIVSRIASLEKEFKSL